MRRPIFRVPPVYNIRDVQPTLTESVGWGLQQLGIPALHQQGVMGEGAIIVFIDTGVGNGSPNNAGHPDLQGALIAAQDFTHSSILAADRQRHGTHTFGTALARRNTTGILGVAPMARGIMGKGLGDDGSGDGDMISRAMIWGCGLAQSMSKGVILSMSLGSNFDDPQIDEALRKVIADGVVPVLAAGNDGGVPGVDQVGYPARLNLCPAIGSFRLDGKISEFSSQGPEVDCAAPGENIVSTVPGGGYAMMSGTSMATPFVAGCLALVFGELIKQNKPIPNAGQVMKLLELTTDDKGAPGPDWEFGLGAINATKMLATTAAPLPPPLIPPTPPPVIVPPGAPPGLGSLLKLIGRFVHTPPRGTDWASIGPPDAA